MAANENEVLEGLAVGVVRMDEQGAEVLRTERARRLLEGTLLADPQRLSRRLGSLAQRCRDGGAASEFFEAAQDNANGLRLTATPLSDGSTLFTVEAMETSASVDERVRQFVAHVTHDLRTPLTSIMGASDLLLSGRVGETNERHERLLRIVSESTERLADLLSEITARFAAPQAEGANQ